jgi:hypothetical protein
MKLYKNDGFTLIELLIGINLTLLTFTFILSFFFTTSKFRYYFEKNLTAKKKTEYFFEMLKKEIDNSQNRENKSFFSVFVFKKDTIMVKDNSLEPVTWEMELLTSKENIILSSAKTIDIYNEVKLSSIKEIILKVILYSHEYLFHYIKPEMPILNFENI